MTIEEAVAEWEAKGRRGAKPTRSGRKYCRNCGRQISRSLRRIRCSDCWVAWRLEIRRANEAKRRSRRRLAKMTDDLTVGRRPAYPLYRR